MSFVGEIETEDSFPDIMTISLMNYLEGIPGVQDIELENKMPCERVLLSSWEQRHCCTLPEDLKQFYFTSDGYRLIWNYEYAGEVLPIGNMRINSISELRRLAGLKSSGDADCPNLLDIEICNQSSSSKMPRPNFGVKCKIFELDPCQGIGKVCLVYLDKCENESDLRREDPKIWLLDRCFEWHFLANDFLQYFRTMLVHMGLPQWQFRFTPMGLTPWAENMFAMVAPHLLQTNWSQNLKWNDTVHIDPAIFRTRRKNSKKKSDMVKVDVLSLETKELETLGTWTLVMWLACGVHGINQIKEGELSLNVYQ